MWDPLPLWLDDGQNQIPAIWFARLNWTHPIISLSINFIAANWTVYLNFIGRIGSHNAPNPRWGTGSGWSNYHPFASCHMYHDVWSVYHKFFWLFFVVDTRHIGQLECSTFPCHLFYIPNSQLPTAPFLFIWPSMKRKANIYGDGPTADVPEIGNFSNGWVIQFSTIA